MPKVIVTKSHKAGAKGSEELKDGKMEWKDGEMTKEECNNKTKDKETPKRTPK